MNIFDSPMTDEDYKRAAALAQFLADNKWTLGEAKRAFAWWYERAGMPREFGDVILMNDLQDFIGAVMKVRAMGEQILCDNCLAQGRKTPLPITPEVMAGTESVTCPVCKKMYKRPWLRIS